MGVTIKHGSNQIAAMSESGRKTLKTGKKYVPYDITVDYEPDSSGGGSGTGWMAAVEAAKARYDTLLADITEENTYYVEAIKDSYHVGNDHDDYGITQNAIPNIASGTATARTTIANTRYWSEQINEPHEFILNDGFAPEGTKASCTVAYKLHDKSYVTFENCIFDSMDGMKLYKCKHIDFNGCYFRQCENGIYMSGCENITIRNCTFEMNNTGLYQYYQGVYLENSNNTIKTTGCTFIADEIINKPFRCGGKSRDGKYASENVTFENCKSYGAFSRCFQNIWSSADLTIKNCEWYLQNLSDKDWLFVDSRETGYETHTNVNDCKVVCVDNGARRGSAANTRFTNVEFVGCGTESTVTKTLDGGVVVYTNCTFTPEYVDGESSSGGTTGGITPTGTITLTENKKSYDVTQYATAYVNVPTESGGSGNVRIHTGTAAWSGTYGFITGGWLDFVPDYLVLKTEDWYDNSIGNMRDSLIFDFTGAGTNVTSYRPVDGELIGLDAGIAELYANIGQDGGQLYFAVRPYRNDALTEVTMEFPYIAIKLLGDE